jgi:hypothetical protein
MQGFPFRRSAPKVPTIHAKCAKTRKGIDIDTIIPKGDSRKGHFTTSLPALPPNGPRWNALLVSGQNLCPFDRTPIRRRSRVALFGILLRVILPPTI